jgi:hypothetical protein
LLLPVFAFMIMTITQELFLGNDFEKLLSAYLSQFSFIQQNQSTLMPTWISTSFFAWFSWLSREFPRRIFAIDMLGMALPVAMAILFFTMTAHKIRDISAESVLLIGVCITPLLMHLVAWDISRIWTYTILEAFLALWIYSEIYPSRNASSVIRLFCLTALVVNAMIRVPLMDGQVDQFSSITRVLLYMPVILSSVILILSSKDITIKDRLKVQGYNLVKIIIPNKRWNSIPETATLESTEESDY